MEAENEIGYEADEEASEEEPCFFIDIEGETFWLDDDDLSCTCKCTTAAKACAPFFPFSPT